MDPYSRRGASTGTGGDTMFECPDRGHTVVPLQLNYPVHNGEAPRIDTSIESVSGFVETDNFHLCRNRFAPKGSNNSRAILLMLNFFGRKIGMRAGDLEGLPTGTEGILVWR